VTFSFKPSATAVGITYTVQQSSSLTGGSWTPVASTINAGTYTATVPVSSARVFLRLKVDNVSGL
jgi:hypothetical protein